MLVIILLMYTGYKISVLEGRKSIDIIQAVKKDHFDDKHIFGAKQGFNIAFAATDVYALTDV